jgi:hypothetical protein
MSTRVTSYLISLLLIIISHMIFGCYFISFEYVSKFGRIMLFFWNLILLQESRKVYRWKCCIIDEIFFCELWNVTCPCAVCSCRTRAQLGHTLGDLRRQHQGLYLVHYVWSALIPAVMVTTLGWLSGGKLLTRQERDGAFLIYFRFLLKGD